jgi:hypothetical protein
LGASLRDEFPRATHRVYLNNASVDPGNVVTEALHFNRSQYMYQNHHQDINALLSALPR